MADNIPAPIFNLDQLTQSFAAKGLAQEEMVTLSGTYTRRLRLFSPVREHDTVACRVAFPAACA